MKHFIRRELPCRRNGDKGKLISVYLARAVIKVTNQFRLCVCVRACARIFKQYRSMQMEFCKRSHIRLLVS